MIVAGSDRIRVPCVPWNGIRKYASITPINHIHQTHASITCSNTSVTRQQCNGNYTEPCLNPRKLHFLPFYCYADVRDFLTLTVSALKSFYCSLHFLVVPRVPKPACTLPSTQLQGLHSEMLLQLWLLRFYPTVQH